ncbi:MAG: ABC transporter permease [Bernardetiaceae bacterium]
MKKLCVFAMAFFWICFQGLAQQVIPLEENQSSNQDGLSVGFSVTNERTQSAGKEEFSRYEITVYLTNQSGCPKIVLTGTGFQGAFGGSIMDPSVFGVFDCINATGRRMTSKSAEVRANQFIVPFERQDTNAEGKTITRTERVQAGFILRDGETISTDIIVLVPLGERPRIQARVTAFSNL